MYFNLCIVTKMQWQAAKLSGFHAFINPKF